MKKYAEIITPKFKSANPNEIKLKIVRWISVALAVVFLFAGVGKLFLFNEFSFTIASLTYLSLNLAKILAAMIIGSEIIGSVALFIRFRLVTISILFCCLVAVFIWVLSMAVIRDKEINCNCFGILGLNLSNKGELILDFILFNSFALLAYTAGGLNKSNEQSMKQNRWILKIAFPIFVVMFEYWLFSPFLFNSSSINRLDGRLAVEYAKRADNQFASSKGGNRLILLMNYSDLSCPVCFDDFSEFSDSLTLRLKDEDKSRIIIFFKSDYFSAPNSSSHLHHWAAANNLNYPIYIMADSLFKNIRFVKSMALIVDRNDKIIFSSLFPMGQENRKHAIELILSN